MRDREHPRVLNNSPPSSVLEKALLPVSYLLLFQLPYVFLWAVK